MIGAKETYGQYSTNHLPIWCQAWYLNAICDKKWDCRYVEENGEIIAVWIFGLTKKIGLKSLNFPTFLKYNGLFFADSVDDKRYDQLGLELIDSLPYGIKMSVEFMPDLHEKVKKVIAVFKKRAFAQRLRQTYIWTLEGDEAALLKEMDGNYRRMINKHIEEVNLEVANKEEASEIYDFHTKWVGDLNSHAVSKSQFQNTIYELYNRGSGEVMNLMKEGDKIASVCLLYDREDVYYLLAVNNKEFKKIYPAVLMAYMVTKHVKAKGRTKIDFLGSDIESISRIWRKLGAKRKEYIYMNKSFILPFKGSIKSKEND